MAFDGFPADAVRFLAELEKNNNRPWFQANKERYERSVRAPAVAFIEAMAARLERAAPRIYCDPSPSGGSLMRIYRDTRFSGDKTPLKTNIAASFPWRGLHRHQGAGLYIEVGPQWVWVGGGTYAPETSQLASVREHIAANHRRLGTIVESPGFRKTVGVLEGSKLQRVPRGFPKDHPAAEYLRHRQFLAGKEFPPEFACDPKFYAGVLGVFRQVAPLIRFLNEPLSKA
jgi:uncharacterized protein (TIGR02453 family)